MRNKQHGGDSSAVQKSIRFRARKSLLPDSIPELAMLCIFEKDTEYIFHRRELSVKYSLSMTKESQAIPKKECSANRIQKKVKKTRSAGS